MSVFPFRIFHRTAHPKPHIGLAAYRLIQAYGFELGSTVLGIGHGETAPVGWELVVRDLLTGLQILLGDIITVSTFLRGAGFSLTP